MQQSIRAARIRGSTFYHPLFKSSSPVAAISISRPFKGYTTTSYARHATTTSTTGGVGLGNVKDQILPSVHGDKDLRSDGTPKSPSYATLSEPRTCSLIPCPMTFGQPFTGTDMGPEVSRRDRSLEERKERTAPCSEGRCSTSSCTSTCTLSWRNSTAQPESEDTATY